MTIMQRELNVSFGIFYVSAYLLAMLLGMGCFLWQDELIFLLGFGFFGCFIAARLAMSAVLAALSVQVAWLIAFLSTTLVNGLLLGLSTLVIYLTHQAVSAEIADNISGLLIAFQLLSAAFIFGGLKLHDYQLHIS
jgi:heme/copper-type cytochrome/quinol oxidase subunit 3